MTSPNIDITYDRVDVMMVKLLLVKSLFIFCPLRVDIDLLSVNDYVVYSNPLILL